ncbi:MAG: PEP-CTERM sorting domain-containing protein [Bryobacterales bacterium]|nr:PEP-CTERM sorting domain-containing protein [Bryobacterales bacterium]
MTLTPITNRTTSAFRALLLLTAAALASANAAPMITPNGNPTSAAALEPTSLLVQSFTLADTWTNVSISASLITFSSGTGTAYLTNQFGAGTTVANQIGTTGFVFTPVATLTSAVSVSLFSGLTLAPGTYYLTFATAEPCCNQGISVNPAMTFTTAGGVSVGSPQNINTGLNALFPPASTGTLSTSTFGNRFFTVTGDLASSAVPEPSTVLLISAGLLAMIHLRKRQ